MKIDNRPNHGKFSVTKTVAGGFGIWSMTSIRWQTLNPPSVGYHEFNTGMINKFDQPTNISESGNNEIQLRLDTLEYII